MAVDRVGWLLHTARDVLQHRYGNPILPFAHSSWLGCAICDPVLTLWCFGGGPSAPTMLRRWIPRFPQTGRADGPPAGTAAQR